MAQGPRKIWLPVGFDDALQLPLQFNMALALALEEENQQGTIWRLTLGLGGAHTRAKRPA
jgi:hypothetical protein